MSLGGRIAASLSVTVAAYAAFVIEAGLAPRSVLPHLPLALVAAAVWGLSGPAAVFASAFVGLGCDVLSAGPIGPGIMACSLAAFFSQAIRRRWELTSATAMILLSATTIMAATAGQVALSSRLTHVPVDWRLEAIVLPGRATTTALLCGAVLMVVRGVRGLQKLATSL